MTLRGLIAAAYGTPQPLPMFRVVGGPGWTDSDRFDVDAKASVDPADLPGGRAGWSPQGQLMLRTLLATRFRLVVHQETQQMASYALIKARSDGKLGPQLVVSEACEPSSPGGAPGSPPAPIACGGFRFAPPERVSGRHLTLDEIARFIMLNAVDRPVLNRTDLAGHFNMDLDFTRALPSPGSPGAAGDREPPVFTGTSIFTALQEQLGLKLEPTRSPLDVVVIDSVTRPEPD